MKKLIEGLTQRLEGTKVYLIELLKSDDMILISKSEFDEDMESIKDHINEIKAERDNVYINEDAIRDAVSDVIYQMDVDDSMIEGLDGVEAECDMAYNELSKIRRKYDSMDKKKEEVINSAVNRVMNNSIDK
jgi:hypothetical protein